MRAGVRAFLTVFRVVLGTLVLSAVATQFLAGLGRPDFHPANFFSYFTIVSNTFGALVVLYAAIAKPSRALDLVRGAAVTALVIVGVVFSALLAGGDDNPIPWVNAVVHYLMPVAIVVDWALDPPATRLPMRDALLWLVLPLAYAAYTLLRGAIVHWYPYPFLNVDKLGYPVVLAYCAGIAAFGLVVAWLVVASGNGLAARTAASHGRSFEAAD
jgi:hypothetical protein